MAEFFVSYTSSDRQWAHWIGLELQKLGHQPRVHEWEVKAGEDVLAWMEKRLEQADHVLCVVSNEYLAARYSTLERNASVWRMVADRPGFALLFQVKPCNLPWIFSHLRRCDLTGKDEERARKAIADFLREPAPPKEVDFPGDKRPSEPRPLTAHTNVPIRVPEHFLGREDDLEAIDASLHRKTNGLTVTAVHGLRGVGKSTLAAAYAERHRANFRATWWVRAETPEGMRADLVALGVRLGWVGVDEPEAPAFPKVMERLRSEGEGLLLIYDNAIDADSLRPFLPKGGAAWVLVTSNAPGWRGLAEPIELKLWPKEIGADYFFARTGGARERADAEALSVTLGGLPLAHEQAAAYCERLHVAFADYARRLAATPTKLLDAEKDAPLDYHDKLTVAKTFALAIGEAAKLHPAAEPLIFHAAFLAPEPIPLFFFEEGREAFGEPLASALADDGLEEALAALETFALVDIETVNDERDPEIATKCFRLHRLVRIVAAARREGEARVRTEAALLSAMERALPSAGDPQDARSWPRLRRLAGLAESLIGAPAAASDSDTHVAQIENYVATFRQFALADYGGARPLFERSLAIREKALGLQHPDTATSLNDLAGLLQAQGDLADARPLFERALAIAEKALGPQHPETATSLNNLALLLHDQGDLARARPLIERALAIHEKALGPQHRATAASLNNLAGLLHAQGDLAGARPLFERALAIDEKAHGSEHPEVVPDLNNLASLLQAQGDLAGARPLFERALAICEKALGPQHPYTATSLNNLASLLRDQGDLAGARPLFERALAIREKALGPQHPHTAASLNNLAGLFMAQGDLAGARPLYERALAIFEKALGPEHPHTKAVADNLVALLAQIEAAGAGPGEGDSP